MILALALAALADPPATQPFRPPAVPRIGTEALVLGLPADRYPVEIGCDACAAALPPPVWSQQAATLPTWPSAAFSLPCGLPAALRCEPRAQAIVARLTAWAQQDYLEYLDAWRACDRLERGAAAAQACKAAAWHDYAAASLRLQEIARRACARLRAATILAGCRQEA